MIVCLICGKAIAEGEAFYSEEFDEWFCEADYAGGFSKIDDGFETGST